MSKGVRNIEVSLDTLCSCYPNLMQEAVIHALQAIDSRKLTSQDIGSYLKHLDDYFCNQGEIRYEGYGLIPKESQAFLDKKLTEWLSFWSIDENSLLGSHRKPNEKVCAETPKD